MENDNKKKVTPEINEELMMNMMADGVKKEGLKLPAEEPQPLADPAQEKPVSKERTRTKKSLEGSYGGHFLKTHTMTKRGEKSIYIRSEYHERLSRIVQVIGQDKIPLYAYLDNILEHHFEMFEKAITDDFNEKFKPIF